MTFVNSLNDKYHSYKKYGSGKKGGIGILFGEVYGIKKGGLKGKQNLFFENRFCLPFRPPLTSFAIRYSEICKSVKIS